MIPRGVEIFAVLEPVDMRWSFDRLAGVVEGRLGREARGRALFLFFGKRRDAAKLLFFDGTGRCIFYKRLDRGTFKLPESRGGSASVEVDDGPPEALKPTAPDIEEPLPRGARVPSSARSRCPRPRNRSPARARARRPPRCRELLLGCLLQVAVRHLRAAVERSPDGGPGASGGARRMHQRAPRTSLTGTSGFQ
jgi:transposase